MSTRSFMTLTPRLFSRMTLYSLVRVIGIIRQTSTRGVKILVKDFDNDNSRLLDPPQTTLLVLAINYVKEAEDAF
eukprot:scaffold6417_cov87-Cyclotella_meneghiniana.AAC.1